VPAQSRTTVWGLVIAVFFVAATLALNAPGGSTSIAGRSLGWAMTKLFPPEPGPLPEMPAAVTPAAPPSAAPPSAAATRPAAPPPARPKTSAGAIRQSAVGARANMAHAPAGVEFRHVYAVMIPGQFNAEKPGEPFLGFCGEISVPEGEGWGRPGWKPFFVSQTISTPTGQTPYLDQANPVTLAKCAGARPSRDYSDIFNDGPTDRGLALWQVNPPPAP
jgi:hypothetical protein